MSEETHLELTKESAQDIIQRIKAGEDVNISHAVIEGEFALAGIEIEGRITIENSRFTGPVDLSHATVKKVLSFKNATFETDTLFTSLMLERDIYLDGAVFRGIVDFSNSTVQGVFHSSSVKFEQKVVFNGSKFHRNVIFENCQFDGIVDFYGATEISGDADFNRAEFREHADFYGATIHGMALFSFAHFKGTANFTALVIGNDAEFMCCVFEEDARFDNIHLGGDAFFWACDFKHVVSFIAARFAGNGEFRGASFNVSSGNTSFNDAQIGGHFYCTLANDNDLKSMLSRIARTIDSEGERIIKERSQKPVTFKGEVEFISIQISGNAEFLGAVFEKQVTFNTARVKKHVFFRSDDNGNRTVFRDKVDFGAAHFAGHAEFSGTIFERQAYFTTIRIEGHALFGPDLNNNRTKFGHTASFIAAYFGGHASFIGAIFEQQANFNGVQIGENASFASALPEENIKVPESEEPVAYPTDFKGDVYFTGAHFGGQTSFSGAVFNEKVDFNAARFSQGAFFRTDAHGNRTTFRGEVYFVGAHFCGQASFIGAVFEDKAYFADIRVDQSAFFKRDMHDNCAIFKRTLHFGRAQIRGNLEFDGAVFEEPANFNAIDINGAAFFRSDDKNNRAWFMDTVDFVGAHFGGPADFINAVFEKHVEFHNVQFAQEVRLEGTHFKSDVGFSNVSCSGVIVLDASTTFKGNVDFKGATYYSIRPVKLWSTLLSRLSPYDRQPFTQLEQSLRRAGEDQLADQVYYIGQRRHSATIRLWPTFLPKLLDFLYFILAGYGVRRWWLLRWSIFVLLGGTLVFLTEGAVVTDVNPPATPQPVDISLPEAIGFALKHFLPIGIPFGNDWVPSSETVVSIFVDFSSAFFATMLTICGWILVPVGIASITGILKRE